MGELSQSDNRAVLECGDYVEKITVGDEFVEWAEKYWGLKQKYDIPEKEGVDELCSYNYVKSIFATKIDEIIKDRLSMS